MKIHLIALGQKMPAWINAGFLEYAKRMPKDLQLILTELPLPLRTKNTNTETLIKAEEKLILSKIPSRCHLIALDEKGNQWNTIQLSEQLKQWKMQGNDICLLIGGPDGLSNNILEKANQTWSLSQLTLPHPLVRVIIAEQLYRASSILALHPYHRV